MALLFGKIVSGVTAFAFERLFTTAFILANMIQVSVFSSMGISTSAEIESTGMFADPMPHQSPFVLE
jgi:hypothetical protein